MMRRTKSLNRMIALASLTESARKIETARRVLEGITKPTAGIQVGSYVEGEGRVLFDLTKEKGMEAIIEKPKDSIYRPGSGRLIGSRSKHGANKNSLLEELQNAKAAEKI
jgi:hypothetical protein